MVRPPSVPESRRRSETATALAERLAREKALDVARRLRRGDRRVVLGADTVVALGRRILGKPASQADARRMLAVLSGRTHRVITGVAVCAAGSPRPRTGRAVTRVTFRRLRAAEISWYVATGEPFDKAGGYGIQGAAGLFVTGIRGSYSNVVGLPLELVYRFLGLP